MYEDPDLFEVLIRASNGVFGGEISAYTERDALARFAETISGFPRTPADRRSFSFGSFGPTYAGGAAALELLCTDSAGHAVVAVRLESDHEPGPAERAELRIPVEAAAVERFALELRSLEPGRGVALLPPSRS